MITKYKIFENKNDIDPKPGDFVLCTTEPRMEPFYALEKR